MYAQSKSGLSPEFVIFDTHTKEDFVKGKYPYYILRPETVETFFILYHFTKDPVYREWGWEIFQAIEEHCKTDAGYAGLRDVGTMTQDNRMESFFLSETLKYLYLLQDDTTEIDLLNTVSIVTFSFTTHYSQSAWITLTSSQPLSPVRTLSMYSILKLTHLDVLTWYHLPSEELTESHTNFLA